MSQSMSASPSTFPSALPSLSEKTARLSELPMARRPQKPYFFDDRMATPCRGEKKQRTCEDENAQKFTGLRFEIDWSKKTNRLVLETCFGGPSRQQIWGRSQEWSEKTGKSAAVTEVTATQEKNSKEKNSNVPAQGSDKPPISTGDTPGEKKRKK